MYFLIPREQEKIKFYVFSSNNCEISPYQRTGILKQKQPFEA